MSRTLLGAGILTALVLVGGLPAQGLDTSFCATWTAAGSASCAGAVGTSGTLAPPPCNGPEPFGNDGSFTKVTSGTSLTFAFEIVTKDTLPFDWIFVAVNGVTIARFNPNPVYGLCAAHPGVANVALPAACAAACTLSIGTRQDGFGDPLYAVITGVVVA